MRLRQPATLMGGLTAFEAVDRQLGLKLALRKYPVPVVAIHHLERKPTRN